MDWCGSSTPKTPEYQPIESVVNKETGRTNRRGKRPFQDPPRLRPQEGRGQTVNPVSLNNERGYLVLDCFYEAM